MLTTLKRIVTRPGVPRQDPVPAWYARTGFAPSLDPPKRNSDIAPAEPLPARPDTDLSAPVLFMARGHSGTRLLAEILRRAGVFMGEVDHQDAVNPTLDSLYWSYGFERPIVASRFRWGEGCRVGLDDLLTLGSRSLAAHLRHHSGGRWGFKTCGGMFAHTAYRHLFPHARYIHLIRDGRDVIRSHDGRLNLAGADSDHPHWHYFKTITFGISQDEVNAPFPVTAVDCDVSTTLSHRYWIQAKSWCEHQRMMAHLEASGELSPLIFRLSYEDLCAAPFDVLKGLFAFLELDMTSEVTRFVKDQVHSRSIGNRRPIDSEEDLEAIMAMMAPDLASAGYDIESRDQPNA